MSISNLYYPTVLPLLQKLGEPIKERRLEHELRPAAVEELRAALQLTRKAVEQWRAGDEKYNHLTDDEMQRVQTSFDTAQRWLDDNASALNPAVKTQDPTIKVSAVREQKHVSFLPLCIKSCCTFLLFVSLLELVKLPVPNALSHLPCTYFLSSPHPVQDHSGTQFCAHFPHRMFGFRFVQSFTSVVTPILSKPKPKVEPPPAADSKDATDNGPTAGTGDHSSQKNSQEEKMDVE